MAVRVAKVDANQSEIVAALREVGATVQSLAAIGKGCPDLLVGWRGNNYVIEIKDGRQPPSHRRLTPDQVDWHDTWNGRVHVVAGVTEALKLLGVL